MKEFEQKQATEKFVKDWQSKQGREDGETELFWGSLLHDVLGVEALASFIRFEITVKDLKGIGYIDVTIEATRVLINRAKE